MPRVSIIVPLFNRAGLLPRAVESVFATGFPDLEIVIVDDGSTDGSPELAQTLAQRHGNRVRCLRHPGNKNKGVAASRNLGIRSSTGDFVAFLDADDFYYPNRFERCIPLLLASKDVDGVYEATRMAYASSGKQTEWENEGEGPLFGVAQYAPITDLLRILLIGQSWHTGGVTVRRPFFEKCGFFPENFRYAEDCHLWFRMTLAGRMVPGDLATPVSAYWRDGANTYQPKLDHRLDMVKAMAEVYRWSFNQRVSEAVRKAFFSGARQYTLGAIIVAREAKRNDLAWAIWRTLFAAGTWRLACDPLIFRQFVAILRRRGATGAVRAPSEVRPEASEP